MCCSLPYLRSYCMLPCSIFISPLQHVHCLANMSGLFDSNESDNDGDALGVEVAGPISSWNPDGISITTEFSNSKAILERRTSRRLSSSLQQRGRATILILLRSQAIIALGPRFLFAFTFVSIRNGSSGLVAIQRFLYASISSR